MELRNSMALGCLLLGVGIEEVLSKISGVYLLTVGSVIKVPFHAIKLDNR